MTEAPFRHNVPTSSVVNIKKRFSLDLVGHLSGQSRWLTLLLDP